MIPHSYHVKPLFYLKCFWNVIRNGASNSLLRQFSLIQWMRVKVGGCSCIFQSIENLRGGVVRKGHAGPDSLPFHSRINALQLTWLHWCNTDKNKISINPVRSHELECENSCGDGNEYGVLHSEWAQLLFGLVDGEACFLYTSDLTPRWRVCWKASSWQMKAEGWLSSSFWILNVPSCVLWRMRKDYICIGVRKSHSQLMRPSFKSTNCSEEKWNCTSPFTPT